MKRLLLAISLSTGPLYGQEIAECKFTAPTASDLSASKETIEKLKTQCLPKLKQVELCLARANLLVGYTDTMLARFNKTSPDMPLFVDLAAENKPIEPDKADINIWRNFGSLQKDYLSALSEIENFTKVHSVIPSDLASIRKKISEFEKGTLTVSDKIIKLSMRELALLAFIESSRESLKKSYQDVTAEAEWLAGPDCSNANTKPTMAKLDAGIKTIISDIDRIHSTILKARESRQKLLNHAYVSLKKRLDNAYFTLAGQELGDIASKIETVIRLNTLSGRFEHWFDKVTYDQARGRTESIYLLYEASRSLYIDDLMIAEGYRKQMEGSSLSHPDLFVPYRDRVDSVIRNVKNKLSRLESRGWQGYLTSQVSASNRRLAADPTKIPEGCKPKVEAFLANAPKVKTIEQYRSSEALYVASVDACSLGEKK